MANAIGDREDRVVLTLGGDEVVICESYDVSCGILEQPNSFSLRLGHADEARKILGRYPSRTPFTLKINDQPQFQGTTDGPESDESSGGTEVVLHGRDDLKFLTDCDIDSELTLKDVTYETLTQAILARPEVGLGGRQVYSSNDANRKLRAGVKVSALAQRTSDQIIASPAAGGTTISYVIAKVGQTWWHVLTQKLKTAGLFLWADAKGNLVLSQPNAQQQPLYRIERWRGKNPNAVNAERSHYRNITTHRHAEYVVFNRIGHRKSPRAITKGNFKDAEMVALGYTNKRVLHDRWVTSPDDADFLARRVCAEERRDGWTLTYEVAGHTVDAIGGGRAVWTPDTVVEVRDDEYGIQGLFYLERVEAHGSPETTTSTLHLMRLEDLIFGGDEE